MSGLEPTKSLPCLFATLNDCSLSLPIVTVPVGGGSGLAASLREDLNHSALFLLIKVFGNSEFIPSPEYYMKNPNL